MSHQDGTPFFLAWHAGDGIRVNIQSESSSYYHHIEFALLYDGSYDQPNGYDNKVYASSGPYEFQAGVSIIDYVIPLSWIPLIKQIEARSTSALMAATLRTSLTTFDSSGKMIGQSQRWDDINASTPPHFKAVTVTDPGHYGQLLYNDANAYASQLSKPTVTITAEPYHDATYTDPNPITDIYITKYEGSITYTARGQLTQNMDGSATAADIPLQLMPKVTANTTVSYFATAVSSAGSSNWLIELPVKPYNQPTISITVARCARDDGVMDPNPNVDAQGNYVVVHVRAFADYKNIVNNSATLTVSYKKTAEPDSTYLPAEYISDIPAFEGVYEKTVVFLAENTESYDIAAEFKDKVITAKDYEKLAIGEVTIDFLAGGKGMAIGKMASREGFEVDWKIFGQGFLDYVHPVGSYYISNDPTSPAELFGGNWEKLEEGTVLMSAGDTYTAGHAYGENEHTLTVDEMPSHMHKFYMGYGNTTSGPHDAFFYSKMQVQPWGGNGQYLQRPAGGGQSHNNMQKSYATNIWRRIG